ARCPPSAQPRDVAEERVRETGKGRERGSASCRLPRLPHHTPKRHVWLRPGGFAFEIFHKRVALRRAGPATAALRRARPPARGHARRLRAARAVAGQEGRDRRRVHHRRRVRRVRRHPVLTDSHAFQGQERGRAVTARGRYVAGLAAVAAAAVALSFVLPPADRRGLWAGLALAVVGDGPLGWWLLWAIGTERFLRRWAVGIAARVGLVGLTALVLGRRVGLPPDARLFALVGLS